MMLNKVTATLATLGIFLFLAGCAANPSGNAKNPQTGSTNNQPSPASKPQELFLSSLEMPSETTGWALSGGTILRTVDGGKHWTDVTPTGAAGSPRFAAQFLDADTGWMAERNGSSSKVTVFRTANGGKTWCSADVPVKTSDAEVYPVSLSFIDAQRGWLMVEPDHGMNSMPGQLFVSTDSGENWSEVASTDGDQGGLPFGGLIAFRNASDGWLVGAKVSTINRSLFMTRDGGRTWSEERQPKMPLVGGTPDFEVPPKFFSPDGKEWILRATFVPDSRKASEYAAFIFSTRDGGRTWQNNPGKLGGTLEFLDMKDAWMWQSEPRDTGSTDPVKGRLYRTWDGGNAWTAIDPDDNLAKYLQKGLDVARLDFVTSRIGWALLWASGSSKSELLRTTDGGNTWTGMEPTLSAAAGQK